MRRTTSGWGASETRESLQTRAFLALQALFRPADSAEDAKKGHRGNLAVTQRSHRRGRLLFGRGVQTVNQVERRPR